MDEINPLSSVNTEINPFEGVTTEARQSVLPEAQVDRTARLAAVADVPAGSPGLLGMYQSAVDNYKSAITTSGDLDIRLRAANKQIIDQTNQLADIVKNSWSFDKTGKMAQGATIAAQHIIQEGEESRIKYALEEEAVKNIQSIAAAGDKTQAQLLIDNLEHGGAVDTLTEINTKHLILQKAIEDAGIDVKNQSWLADAVDFVAGFLPLYTSTGQVGNVSVDDAAKHWYDSLFSGQRKSNEASALWSMSTKDFANYIPTLIDNIKNNSTFMGYINNSERLNLLSEMDKTSDPKIQNIYNGLDNLGLVAAIKPLKAVASIPITLVRNGARQEAAGVVAQTARQIMTDGTTAAEKAAGVSVDEIQTHLMPDIVNPVTEGKPVVPLSTPANLTLDRTNELLSKLPEFQVPSRLTPDEQKAAFDSFVQRVTEPVQDRVVNIQPSTVKLTTGQQFQRVDITLGKSDGKGFASEKSARRWANSFGYSAEEIVRDESGQYFVKVSRDIPETGFYTEILNPQSWSSGLLRHVASAKNLSDQMLASAAQMAGNTQNRILKTVVEPLAKKISGLGSEREKFAQVMAAANSNQHWFTTDEFNTMYQRAFNRAPTAAEHEAYQAYRDASDLEYLLRNDSIYLDKVTKGYKTVTFDSPMGNVTRGNALVDTKLSEVPKNRVYDTSANVHYNETNPLTSEKLEELRAQGYRLVKTEQAVDLADGTTINHFLVKPQDLQVENLSRTQLGYAEGGHRMYEGKYFVKQAKTGLQADTGREFLRNPSVHIVADTPAQAGWWADQMNNARMLVKSLAKGSTKELRNFDELEDVIEKSTRLGSHAGLPTPEEFLKGVQDGTYNLDHAFEALYDREMPSAYRGPSPDVLDFSEPRESGLDGFLRSQGRMYSSPKGEQLHDFNGELAKTVDPFKTINRSLLNVAKLSSFSDYRQSAIERWVNTFKSEFDNYIPDVSSQKMFDKATWKSDTPDRIKKVAETQRDIIKRNLGWQTEADMAKTQTARRLSEWISGTDPEISWRQSLSAKVENWWESKSPLTSLRGFAFDAHLGFFNPAQLFLQAGTAVTAFSMNLGDGAMHGLKMMWPLRHYLMKSVGEEELLSHYVEKGLWKDGGFSSPAEFKSYMRTAKQSGFFDFGNSHQLVNAQNLNTALSDFRNGVDQVRTAGRVFFNEGETWNRLMAWRFAWRDAKQALPGVAETSPEFQAKVASRSEDWAFQMSNQSQAAWQSGLASIPTQFWAYNARMMELAFGKTFTPAQRAKLVFSQLFLTGAAGTPITYELLHQYQKMTGEHADLNTWQGMLQRGILDSILYHTTGVDATVGERIGTGNFIPETIRGIFGMSSYGEKSAAEVFGGVTMATAENLGKTLYDVTRYAVAESGGDSGQITRDVVTNLASNITTLSNINKAYLVWKYGTLRSNGGTLLKDDAPTVDGFAQLLGFAPGAGLAATAQQEYLKNQQEQVSDLSKQIVILRQKAFSEPDHTDDYINQINLLMKMYPNYIREQALAKAHKSTPDSLYDTIAKRYNRERTEELSQYNQDEGQ